LDNLVEFYAYRNIFSGNIYTQFDEVWEHLGIVGVDHNILTGSLPAVFGQMPIIEQLFVDSNCFSGGIDIFDAELEPLMQYIELSTNQFTGTYLRLLE
jgi:hypothetical protein